MQSEPRYARITVWALPISLAATFGITFVFSSSGYLDVSVHRVPSAWLWIHHTVRKVFLRGFPHSDICGSLCICHSPQLFAAYHVFRRLSVPRHPPCALSCLTSFSYLSSVADMNFCFFLLAKKTSKFLLDVSLSLVCFKTSFPFGKSFLLQTLDTWSSIFGFQGTTHMRKNKGNIRRNARILKNIYFVLRAGT